MTLASDDTRTMNLRWYISVLPEDGDKWLDEGGDCPHYFFAELTLQSSTPFLEGAVISQFFAFWEVDPTIPSETEIDVPDYGEQYTFAESVKITA